MQPASHRSRTRDAVLILALVLVAPTAGAVGTGPSGSGKSESETTDFPAIWNQYRTGKDVRAALEKLIRDTNRGKKERFNAAYLSAVIHLAHGDPTSALTALGIAEQMWPGTPQVMVRRAEAELQQGKPKAASTRLKRAFGRVRKDKASAIYLRHQILTARAEAGCGRPKKAVSRLERLARRHRKSWEVHFFLGNLSEELDDPKQALAAYDQAIQHLPESDPVIGVYALQRWAALAVSSDGSSYGKPKLLAKAIDRYEAFLRRARANHVPRKLVNNVRQTVAVLRRFGV